MAPAAPWTYRSGCNSNATRRTCSLLLRLCVLAVVSVGLTGLAARPAAAAGDPPASETKAEEGRDLAACVEFLGGAAAGFIVHEAAHVTFDVAMAADPGVKRVSFGPIPFFAITHRDDVSSRQEYAISSAGFWLQHASSEWILTRRPHLREEHAPFAKGWLAWNVLASVAYSGAAFGRIGPPERDTRGMARSLGIAEPWVGGLLLAPALLDAWRFHTPDATWARWLSRGIKVALVLAVVAADEGSAPARTRASR